MAQSEKTIIVGHTRLSTQPETTQYPASRAKGFYFDRFFDRLSVTMTTSISQQLRACGRNQPPEVITVLGQPYRFCRLFKHDFFACTSLYQRSGLAEVASQQAPDLIVMKTARRGDLLGVPLWWLGRALCDRETAMLEQIRGIDGVPNLLERYDSHSLVYAFIPGKTLDEKPQLPDTFFRELATLTRTIHKRNIAYLDMNKRGNILLRPDGSPGLIDFQIAVHLPRHHPLFGSLYAAILRRVRREDFYHIRKHRRRFHKHRLTQQQLTRSRRVSGLIALHRRFVTPLNRLRRAVLGSLSRRGHLTGAGLSSITPETDPARWMKS
jgi:hypothetical protein